MFDTAELGRVISKQEFAEKAAPIRLELLETQFELRKAPFPVIVLFGGVDGAGKSETVNLLHEWLDPRWLLARAYGDPTEEARQRPPFWRYWRDLPPKGRIGIFLSAWYSDPILNRVYDGTTNTEFDEALERILAFEKALADDGALIVKFWMHLGKETEQKRLKQLEEDPLTKWRVKEQDWKNWEHYDQFIEAAERALMRTNRGRTPWHIVEGTDERYRTLSVAGTLLGRIQHHMKLMNGKQRDNGGDDESTDPELPTVVNGVEQLSYNPTPEITILSHLNMEQSLAKEVYAKRLEELQGKLDQLSREAKDCGVSTVLVFEGWDAAGKGGAIRRVIPGLDARLSQVIPIMKPTEEESSYHYLWRFWRHIPLAGRVTIFDRSWYGRVLVERVEGFASEGEWKRAYAEINDFEEQLVQKDYVLCKFWLHITKDEQKKRFDRRQKLAHKKWKITEEDFRNRDKWDAYEIAVNEMIERTSTFHAHWTLVEANNKRFARIKVLETICNSLEAGIAAKREKEGIIPSSVSQPEEVSEE